MGLIVTRSWAASDELATYPAMAPETPNPEYRVSAGGVIRFGAVTQHAPVYVAPCVLAGRISQATLTPDGTRYVSADSGRLELGGDVKLGWVPATRSTSPRTPTSPRWRATTSSST